jgi:hypothetical protein
LPLTQAGQNLHFSIIFDFFDGDSSVSSSSSESNVFTENVNKEFTYRNTFKPGDKIIYMVGNVLNIYIH